MVSIADHVRASEDDLEAITVAALDYLAGYVTGDAERHARAYHPEAIKRRFTEDEDGIFGMNNLSPQTMSDYAATQDSPEEADNAEIFIDDVAHDIASVRVYSPRWVDFLHIVKARGEWKLLHGTWHSRTTPSSES